LEKQDLFSFLQIIELGEFLKYGNGIKVSE